MSVNNNIAGLRTMPTKRPETQSEKAMKDAMQIGLAVVGALLLVGTIAAIVALSRSSHTHTIMNRVTHQMSTVKHSNAALAIPVGMVGAMGVAGCAAGVVSIEADRMHEDKSAKKAGAKMVGAPEENMADWTELSDVVKKADGRQAEAGKTPAEEAEFGEFRGPNLYPSTDF